MVYLFANERINTGWERQNDSTLIAGVPVNLDFSSVCLSGIMALFITPYVTFVFCIILAFPPCTYKKKKISCTYLNLRFMVESVKVSRDYSGRFLALFISRETARKK